MRRIRTWLALGMVGALAGMVGMVGLAGPAGAGDAPDVCESLVSLDADLGGIESAVDLADFDRRAFREVGKAFAAAASDASTTSLKKSLKTLAKVYKKAAKARDAQGARAVFVAKARPFSDATIAVAGYLSTECSGVEAPQGTSPSAAGGDTTRGATVTVDSSEYVLDESRSCTLNGGALLSRFEDGNDMVTITSTGSVVLVRMTIEGDDWVDQGSPPEPDVSGKRVRWAGEMSKLDGGETADVTIEFTC